MLKLVGLTLIVLAITMSIVLTVTVAFKPHMTIYTTMTRPRAFTCVKGRPVIFYTPQTIKMPAPVGAYTYDLALYLGGSPVLKVMKGSLDIMVSRNPSLEAVFNFYTNSIALKPGVLNTLRFYERFYHVLRFNGTLKAGTFGSSNSIIVHVGSRSGTLVVAAYVNVNKVLLTLPSGRAIDEAKLCKLITSCWSGWCNRSYMLALNDLLRFLPDMYISVTSYLVVSPIVASRIAIVFLTGLAILVYDAYRRPEDYASGFWRVFRRLAGRA